MKHKSSSPGGHIWATVPGPAKSLFTCTHCVNCKILSKTAMPRNALGKVDEPARC